MQRVFCADTRYKIPYLRIKPKAMRRLLFLMLFIPGIAAAQPQAAKARMLYQKGLEMRDAGNIGESIRLFSLASQADTTRFEYFFELGYTCALSGYYPQALEASRKAVRFPESNDTCYQVLANVYDISGDTASAMRTLEEGLLKFPASGKLYLEKGHLLVKQNANARAAAMYEEGIRREPNYASNYFYAAQLSLQSNQKINGLIYGEQYLLLQTQVNERTSEMRALLFKHYTTGFHLKASLELYPAFCNSSEPNSFCNLYQSCLNKAAAGMKHLTFTEVGKVRSRAMQQYMTEKYNDRINVPLFTYFAQINEAGLADAYQYWVLGAGDKEAFVAMQENPELAEQYQQLLGWLAKHPFVIDAGNVFTGK